MARILRSRRILVPTAVIIGIFLAAFVSAPLLVRTTAIAAPFAVFAWVKAQGILPLSLLARNTLAMSGLAVALPLWMLFAGMPMRRLLSLACMACGVLLALYALMPLHTSGLLPSPFTVSWWQHGFELSLPAAIALAYGASRVTRTAIVHSNFSHPGMTDD